MHVTIRNSCCNTPIQVEEERYLMTWYMSKILFKVGTTLSRLIRYPSCINQAATSQTIVEHLRHLKSTSLASKESWMLFLNLFDQTILRALKHIWTIQSDETHLFYMWDSPNSMFHIDYGFMHVVQPQLFSSFSFFVFRFPVCVLHIELVNWIHYCGHTWRSLKHVFDAFGVVKKLKQCPVTLFEQTMNRSVDHDWVISLTQRREEESLNCRPHSDHLSCATKLSNSSLHAIFSC